MSVFVKGVDGAVYYGGEPLLHLDGFNLSMDAPTEETAGFGSSGSEPEYTGVVMVNGSFNGEQELFDTSTGGELDTPQMDIMQMFEAGSTMARAYAKFIETTKSMWHGYIMVTNISKDHPSQGIAKYTGNFVGYQRLTHASSTST